MTGLGSFGGPSLRHEAGGWRGQWGLLLSPLSACCLLLVWALSPFQVSMVQEEALGSGSCWEGSVRGPQAHVFLGLGRADRALGGSESPRLSWEDSRHKHSLPVSH